MSDTSPFSGELIQQSTEAVGNFLRWIASLIVTRNWFSLLILVAIAGLFLFNPWSGFAFKLLGIELEKLPAGYGLGFGLAEAGLLLVALGIAVKTMPRAVSASRADTADRKAIKGLRPFDAEDAEVFAQLQRQQNLRECLDSVTSQGFRFGILHGESGCGKTSFLQAGVWPRLRKEQAEAVGVYVRFSDQAPIRTIAKAISEQLEIPLDWLLPVGEGQSQGQGQDKDSLIGVLGKVAESIDQPLILLLDQFEQFFVHHKRKEQRQPFIQNLTDWYQGDRTLPIRIVVAVRSDLMYLLDELHQALGYSLAPQDVFRLEKFTPMAASKVLEAIAQTEGLAFNRDFVTELAQEELANREDGLISPVDLQILAWMIERQTADELRAFNRSAFEKFGGVEGLLQRFLERTLEARVTDGQRQSVVKVLLALTDLERQVRAGMLTAAELTAKLQGSAKAEEVEEALCWLVRGDVRLITPQEKEGVVAYELAHERLIPALMRQAGKELSAVDKANQLMDRRVNEWLGNRCDRRYYFGVRELWLLRQQQPYLVWGAKREQKEKLLRLSRRRVYGGFSALLALVIVVSSLFGWLNFSTSGQVQKMQWQLSRLVRETSSGEIIAEAAVAFAKNDQWERAFAIATQELQRKETLDKTSSKDADLATFIRRSASVSGAATFTKSQSSILSELRKLSENIQDDSSKSSALREIAAAYVELGDPEIAKTLLSDALTAASAIQSDSSKSSALRAIAAATGELGDPEIAKTLLSDALTAASAIQSDSYKSDALRAVLNAGVALEDNAPVQSLLKEGLDMAHRERVSEPMVLIANYHASQSNWFQALHALSKAEDREKTVGLSQLLTFVAEQKQTALIEGPIVLPIGADGIEHSKQPDGYQIKVQINSPNESCELRADWWEVLTPEGTLIKRHLIDPVYIDKRDFESEVESVDIDTDQTVLIRAHFSGQYYSEKDLLVDDRLRDSVVGGTRNRSGYTDQALKGSISDGFKVVRLSENFAKNLEKEDPLPQADICSLTKRSD